MCGLDLSQFAKYWMIPGHMIIKLSTVLLEVVLVQTGLLLEFGSLAPLLKSVFFIPVEPFISSYFIRYSQFLLLTLFILLKLP